MKRILFVAAAALVAACTSGPPVAFETPDVDREFGQATRESFARQIAYPDRPHAAKVPAGLEGVFAEPVMQNVHKSYAKTPETTDVFELGVEED